MGEWQPIETAAFIEVDAGVRYWEDAEVNGVEDADGTLIPHREGDRWRLKISLSDGRVQNWPAGVVASVHYKVCDDGEYWLLNSAGKRIAKSRGYYVPDAFLCHGDNGHGDYIIMQIGADGAIAEYRRPDVDPEEWQPLPAPPEASDA